MDTVFLGPSVFSHSRRLHGYSPGISSALILTLPSSLICNLPALVWISCPPLFCLCPHFEETHGPVAFREWGRQRRTCWSTTNQKLSSLCPKNGLWFGTVRNARLEISFPPNVERNAPTGTGLRCCWEVQWNLSPSLNPCLENWLFSLENF